MGMSSNRKIALIGAPLCDGERERGVEKAPSALRAAGLLDSLRRVAEVIDFGDLSLPVPIPDQITGKLRNLESNVAGCQLILGKVSSVLSQGYFPLIIGGDCSLFPAAIAAIKGTYKDAQSIYFDGDADFHTPETTSSGYFSGMDVATVIGQGPEKLTTLSNSYPIIAKSEITLLGVRKTNVDPVEFANLNRSRIRIIWNDELILQNANKLIIEKTKISKPVYLHFDVDALDAREMPAQAGIKSGVHTPGGLSMADTVAICSNLSRLPLVGFEVTLYDPNLDPEQTYARKIVQLVTCVIKSASE